MKNKILKGKTIGVLGMARSGIAAANLAARLGAKVLVSDVNPRSKCAGARALDRGIEQEFGGHSDRLLESDRIIKSPGIPGDIPLLKAAKKRNIPVEGEIEFAARLINPLRTVVITGTNGKTTTTELTGKIFKAAGGRTVVAGNIGLPLAAAAGEIDRHTTVVIEMSSYQLEDSRDFHPDAAAILNITPDHLEHHHTMKKYAEAKARIFANQGKNDWCALNYDDRRLRVMAKRCPSKVIFFSRKNTLRSGVYYRGDRIVIRIPGLRAEIDGRLAIPGLHNRENALAAVALAACSGVNPDIIEKVIGSFPGVEHRIELCGEKRGVRYFNDSKATNVDSTRVALESFADPVWLILGGRDKGAPYAPLRKLIMKSVKGILLIGEAAPLIRKEFKGLVELCDCATMANAVAKAASIASAGDIVLLSPACASFDQFKDYEDRGRQFKSLVKKLR